MRLTTLSIAVSAALGMSTALVAAGTSAPKPAPACDAAVRPGREPAALDALVKMGAYLRTLQMFSVHAQTRTEETLASGPASGQKIQLSSVADIRVRRPDRLRVDLTSDRKDRHFYYDGKSFTVSAPKLGYYASVPAPARLGALVTEVRDRYDIELPLVDLFYWGTDAFKTDEITSAIDVGPSTIDGVETEQYAFRQPGLDWQIWIQKGAQPLPRRLVLTSTNAPSQPDHAVDLTWNLAPAVLDNDVFTFIPLSTEHRITFAEMKPEQVGAK